MVRTFFQAVRPPPTAQHIHERRDIFNEKSFCRFRSSNLAGKVPEEESPCLHAAQLDALLNDPAGDACFDYL